MRLFCYLIFNETIKTLIVWYVVTMGIYFFLNETAAYIIAISFAVMLMITISRYVYENEKRRKK